MEIKNKQFKERKFELDSIQKGKKIEKSGSIRKEAHLSTRNKHDQAKRDKHSSESKSNELN